MHMQADIAKTESELMVEFFAGLDAGLTSLREVRTAYDEQIAFDFNMLRLFKPGETKVSEILAFFLDPKQKHGQKIAFLQKFIEHFDLKPSDEIKTLLSADIDKIEVTPEYRTQGNRLIDIVVFFKNAKFAIGIENKINAEDQPKQVWDYCKDLESKTQGNYKLLYLSRYANPPSEGSLPKAERERLSEKIKCVSYGEIVDLLKKYETVCRADNVRGFIRQFQQYIKQDILGEPSMDETNFVIKCLRNHPDILKHPDALSKAVESLKEECFNGFWSKVADHLNSKNIRIQPQGMQWRTSRNSSTDVEHPDSPFKESGELKRTRIYFEPNFSFPVYIAIGLSANRNSLGQALKDKVAKLEDRLKVAFPDDVLEPRDIPWCAIVRLPYPEFNNSDELCMFLKDKEQSNQGGGENHKIYQCH